MRSLDFCLRLRIAADRPLPFQFGGCYAQDTAVSLNPFRIVGGTLLNTATGLRKANEYDHGVMKEYNKDLNTMMIFEYFFPFVPRIPLPCC